MLLLLVLAVSCKSKSKQADKPKDTPPVIVDVMIAQAQPITDTIEANGTVLAGEYLEIHPEVSGRLTYLNIPEGMNIAKGTVLARINDADLRAQLGKSRVQLELANTTVQRYKKLLDVSGINQSDYDLAVSTASSYRADIEYTRSLIAKTVVRAPFSGIAGLRQVSPGAYVSPTTVLASLQQVSQVKIDFTLPEAYGNVIRIGSLIDVLLDGNRHVHAKIIATEPGANTDTRNLKVRAVLADANVNPGAFVKVFINAGEHRNAIKVPSNAIIPQDKSNQLVTVKEGKAVFANVLTGNREAGMVEILSGISAGDSVVVNGVLFTRPNGKVKVRSVRSFRDMQAADSIKTT